MHSLVFYFFIIILCNNVFCSCRYTLPLRNLPLKQHKMKELRSTTVVSVSSCFSGIYKKNEDNVSLVITMPRGGFLTTPILDESSSTIPEHLMVFKLLVQVGLFLFNISCWLIPLRNKHLCQNDALLSLANCVAGGIFLMLSFGHLLPETINHLTAGGQLGTDILPFVLVGYLAMFMMAKVAFDVHHPTSHQHELVDGVKGVNSECSSTPWYALNSAQLLCLVLSVHSFFEAASLGMASDRTSVAMLAVCIALHQPAESIALLVAFFKTNMPVRAIIPWLLGYSGVTLLGQCAGQMVKQLASDKFEGRLAAITAGTFIFVGATEIANEEFESGVSHKDKLHRFFAYLLGMGLMGGVIAIGERLEGVARHQH